MSGLLVVTIFSRVSVNSAYDFEFRLPSGRNSMSFFVAGCTDARIVVCVAVPGTNTPFTQVPAAGRFTVSVMRGIIL
jgi:hypothetical protein